MKELFRRLQKKLGKNHTVLEINGLVFKKKAYLNSTYLVKFLQIYSEKATTQFMNF